MSKEFFVPSELTVHTSSSTLNGRSSFMDGGLNTEAGELGKEGVQSISPERVFLTRALGLSLEQVNNAPFVKGRIEKLADEFERTSVENPTRNPFDVWDNKRLKDEYFGFSIFQRRVLRSLRQSDRFQEETDFIKKTSFYKEGLINELKRRDREGIEQEGQDNRKIIFVEVLSKQSEIEKDEEERRVKPSERVKLPKEDVLANSLLSNSERLIKAEKLLGRELSEKEKDAILSAHYVGVDRETGEVEQGKEGGKAGVYNYKPSQLLRKIRILEAACFSPRERSILIEAGIAATGESEDRKTDENHKTGEDYEEDLFYFFKNQFIRKQLESEIPDFSYKEITPDMTPEEKDKNIVMKQFENFIKGLSVNRTSRGEDPTIVRFAELLASISSGVRGPIKIGEDERRGDNGKIISEPIMIQDVEMSETTRRLLFESVLEGIISIPDKVPDEHYSEALGHDLETPTALKRLMQAANKGFNKDFDVYIAELISRRQMAHELNISFKFGEEYKKFVVTGLRPEGIDFIHNDVAGVALVIREYERFAADMLREKKEWFKQDDVIKIDKHVKEVAENLYKAGLMKVAIGKNGEQKERVLTKWEIDRALRMAKIVFRGTQRMAMYAGMGHIPPEADFLARIGSVHDEYIVRDLVPEKILIARFSTNSGQVAMMRQVIEEIKKYNKSDDKYVGLFGLDEEAVIFADSGAPDPESHSWRMRVMFLAGIKMEAGGTQTTLQKILAQKARYYKYDSEKVKRKPHSLLAEGSMNKKEKDNFCEDAEVRKAVLGQTMYLSILARHSDFNFGLKTHIWKKIATYNPSTIASLLAENAIGTKEDKETWEGLRLKLHIAEEARFHEESEKYRDVLTDDDLTAEMKRYISGGDAYKYQIEKYFSEKNGNTLENHETTLLRRIIDAGYNNAKTLAIAKMPFTYCIVDAPKTLWDVSDDGTGGMEASEMIRLMSSDHQNISESWSAIGKNIESPTREDFAKNHAEAVDKFAAVHGRKDSQKKFEPFLVALLNMSATDEKIAFMKTILEMARIPTSEMEKYFMESYFSFGAEERADIIQALAQLKAISDDKSEKGETQLDRVKRRTKSKKIDQILELFRTISLLFGPVFAIAFLKTLLPGDMGKALS